MCKKLLISLSLIIFFCLFLIYGVPKIGPVHFEFEPTHDIYYGDIITEEDFECHLIFKDETKIKIPIKGINKEFAEPELTFSTILGEKQGKINLIDIDSFNFNLPTNYVQAGAPFNFPDNFQATIVYKDGKQLILKEQDLQISWDNTILQHGENVFVAQWHNIFMEGVVNALAHPIVQSEEFPMYYQDLNTIIEITKERYADSDCFVAHIVTTDPLVLKTAFAEGQYNHHQVMSEVMTDNNAVFMINGDFADYGNGYPSPTVREGQIITDITAPVLGERTLGLTTEGHLYEVTKNLYWEIENNHLRHSWTFYKGFTIINGERTIVWQGTKNPRTFIGEVLRDDEKLEYYLVVADGRRPDSRGVCLADEGAFLFDKGCSIAYNLDGGGSSEMMFDGKIINIPSGGHERKDHDFIYVELWDGNN